MLWGICFDSSCEHEDCQQASVAGLSPTGFAKKEMHLQLSPHKREFILFLNAVVEVDAVTGSSSVKKGGYTVKFLCR